MDMAVSAYPFRKIQAYLESVLENGLSEPGFCRLTANIGILLAFRRRQDLKKLFIEMMDACCQQIPTALIRHPMAGNEFSVKEIVPCILLLEEQKTVSEERIQFWKKQLKRIHPENCYRVIAKNEQDRVDNWAAYGAASEQTRKYAKIADEDSFIQKQIASQLLSFDENGMYRDPNEPAVYDISARLQLSAALYFGYNGIYREKLDQALKKGGICTLYMQSPTGEIPYGGRSNQFLHNEAMLAGILEYEAARYHKLGNLDLAGQFKAAAVLAQNAILKNLNAKDPHHIKNNYPPEQMYGCESYAYFDKYMVTIGSFCYLAYLFSDDRISPRPCPAERGGYIFHTTPYFHRTVMNCGEYFVQYDTHADFHYDANGLGRVQRKDAPSPICLSVPFPKQPEYQLDLNNPSPVSICWGIRSQHTYILSSEPETKYQLLKQQTSGMQTSLAWKCRLRNGTEATETCIVKKSGVSLYIQYSDETNTSALSEIFLILPAFFFDGKSKTQIIEKTNLLAVIYKGWCCQYKTSGTFFNTHTILANRNGHYHSYIAKGTQEIHVDIQIFPISSELIPHLVSQ